VEEEEKMKKNRRRRLSSPPCPASLPPPLSLCGGRLLQIPSALPGITDNGTIIIGGGDDDDSDDKGSRSVASNRFLHRESTSRKTFYNNAEVKPPLMLDTINRGRPPPPPSPLSLWPTDDGRWTTD
jgi:hypothetical protein